MQNVKAWEEEVIFPTYKIGEPDKNPMFQENRVYQGSSGVVYPHPVIDKVYDEKADKAYQAVFLENDYLKIMILPEIGGRIQMAYDKTNDYHFIYYNRVIKPALVGLTGPWISGGIEFNWPQHHRPSTFSPVDYSIEENNDGSKTMWVNEIEIMFHTKGMAGFTLYPDKAYLEVKGKLYNRTSFPQSFLWWANPAVHVDEHYQSVFPPDVTSVYDHGKRDVSTFPIATGSYYKVDYSPGTDISRYQNIPVPTSYMAVNSAYDFVGGYHHGKKVGMLHVADHHLSPGKKQWTWGSGKFGKMWDKQLTDEDGPYFEIMTGVYTDNQPDFSWIMPNEERTFTQYFLPYKEIGYVKNASKEAAVNVELNDGKIIVKIYVTSVQSDAHIILKDGIEILLDATVNLSPTKTFYGSVDSGQIDINELWLQVFDREKKLLVQYRQLRKKNEAIPQPANPIGNPQDIKTIDELYLAGLHLEQYRHATYSPVTYYREGISRDPSDIRCNNALGLWYVKHGQFSKAEPFFHKAIEKLTRHNPNPYNGEPYYNQGICFVYLDKWGDAYDAFYKSSWNAAWQDNAFFQLACIDCRKGDYEKALEHIENSLARNYHGMKARHLKAILLRKLDQLEEAEKWIYETLAIDPFDFGSRNELCLVLISKGNKEEAEKEKQRLRSLARDWEQTYLEIAIDYAHAGFYEEAIAWLVQLRKSTYPMVYYYMAYYYSKINLDNDKEAALKKGFHLPEELVFPNRLEDIEVLQFAGQENRQDYKIWYYLGNLWYDKRQYKEARQCWEQSVAIRDDFPTSRRNLGIAYYNKFDQPKKALKEYEAAFGLNTSDSRILFELDQLYKRINIPVKDRIAFLSSYIPLINERDDLYIEYITLHNLLGMHEEALQLLKQRWFHPWEGGEGKVSRQYVCAKTALAKKAMQGKEFDLAILILNEALQYPENLGEGKLYVAQENNVYYLLGCTYEAKNNLPKAKSFWQSAANGASEPVQAIYYNDQSPAMIYYQGLALQKLDKAKEAKQRFKCLINYGKAHIKDNIKIDYFAVSLPELSVFDIDWVMQNRIHCHFLMGLGCLGIGSHNQAKHHFNEILKMDNSHQGTTFHLLSNTDIMPTAL